MPLFAGVCETNITPPVGVEMAGYGWTPQSCLAIQDELYARALALENGNSRAVVVSADLLSLTVEMAGRVRDAIAERVGTNRASVLLNCSHTHGGPNTGILPGKSSPDSAYLDILERKLVAVAVQAMEELQAATLTYGEATTQIGANRRQRRTGQSTQIGRNWGGTVLTKVQNIVVQSMEGELIAMLFSHACHPTTLGIENRRITAEWCGVAVERLKARFRQEAVDAEYEKPAVPMFLQGCCADINPVRRGTWEAVRTNGKRIADAAHSARWNAHGWQTDAIRADEITVHLPTMEGTSELPTLSFAIQRLTLGHIHLLAFPAEMFAYYARDFMAQCSSPVIALGYTNGCIGYVPTAAEFPYGGYEVDVANQYFGSPFLTPDCEPIIRRAVYELLDIEEPDTTPYPVEK